MPKSLWKALPLSQIVGRSQSRWMVFLNMTPEVKRNQRAMPNSLWKALTLSQDNRQISKQVDSVPEHDTWDHPLFSTLFLSLSVLASLVSIWHTKYSYLKGRSRNWENVSIRPGVSHFLSQFLMGEGPSLVGGSRAGNARLYKNADWASSDEKARKQHASPPATHGLCTSFCLQIQDRCLPTWIHNGCHCLIRPTQDQDTALQHG